MPLHLAALLYERDQAQRQIDAINKRLAAIRRKIVAGLQKKAVAALQRQIDASRFTSHVSR